MSARQQGIRRCIATVAGSRRDDRQENPSLPLMGCLLGLCLLFVSVNRLAAQTEKGERYALLVGVQDYDRKELKPLSYSRNDIIELNKVLLASGFKKDNIVLMHDKQPARLLPESKKIRHHLNLLLRTLHTDDTLIVAFSGHGIQFKGDERSYFCPLDVELSDKETLMPLEELYKDLKRCKARRKLLLVDACRNDPQSDLSKGALPELELESVSRPQRTAVPEGIVAVFSCTQGERSWEYPDLKHGVFFYHWLKGWQGAAARDGKLTVEDVVAYTVRETETFARVKLEAVQRPYQRNEFSGTWRLPSISTKLDQLRFTAEAGDSDAQLKLGWMYLNGQGVDKNDAAGFKWLEKSARQGNADAQNGLGVLYALGRGVARNESEAIAWYRRAAQQGHATAQTNLAFRYEKGLGVEMDEVEAAKWYRKAAEKGNAKAQNSLGDMYGDGRGVEVDYGEAIKWYRKAADQGYLEAQKTLGVMYQEGWGVRQDYFMAVKWYRMAAEKGFAEAQMFLGVMYVNGWGVAKDQGAAVTWFGEAFNRSREAAEKGDLESQTNLGMMYLNGWGVAKDEATAFEWFRKAAERGNVDAQFFLGYLYANARDVGAAITWYRKAADRGNSSAQNALGVMYQSGLGVEQNYGQAIEWYRKAAARELKYAQANLGVMYLNGWGVDQDYAQALKWFRKAAEREDPLAQESLGFLHESGLGVEKDLQEAIKWYRKAAEAGSANARARLQALSQEGDGSGA